MICVNVYLGTLLKKKKKDFELTDGKKFFKVAWHNTSHGMWSSCFWLRLYPCSYKKKKNQNPKASLKKVPPQPVLCYRLWACQGWDLLLTKHVLVLGPKSHLGVTGQTGPWGSGPSSSSSPPAALLLQLCDSWRGWKLPGRWCQAVAWETRSWKRNGLWWLCSCQLTFSPQILAKSNLHHKACELQKETKTKTKK